MITISDKTGSPVAESKVLMIYFGKKEGQSLSEFYAEIKALTPESKTELAIGAAKELGWEVVES